MSPEETCSRCWGNNADREYFKVHAGRGDLGLHAGRPAVSRLTGERMMNFSRRIDKPDGFFGGVVVGTIKLAYFRLSGFWRGTASYLTTAEAQAWRASIDSSR